MMVCDFVDGNGQWAWDRFQDFLPTMLLIHIAVVKPPSTYYGEDKIYWNLSKSGKFTLASAYNLVAGREWTNVSARWKLVWSW